MSPDQRERERAERERERERERGEESDTALGHLEEEAPEAAELAPDRGPWMRVSTA